MFSTFVEASHERGYVVGLNCSGVAWTNYSNTGDGNYTRVDQLETEGLLHWMCMGPSGEYESLICNDDSIRWGYDICVSTPFAREVMTAETLKIAHSGVDHIRLFDQNISGASYQCCDVRHGHPAGTGP